MGHVIDNLIAYRVLSMLVKPFDQTEAFKQGIVDAQGHVLIKASDLKTQEQKAAYNYLTRLVFNLKRLINKLPGGDTKLKNLVAAFFLIREAMESRKINISEDRFDEIVNLVNEGYVFAEEQLIIEDFMLVEDAPANATGAGVSTDTPLIKRKPKRFARFTVNDDIYNKFANGKAKFRKWSQYLNLEDEGQKMIYDFARKNPNGVIVLHNGKDKKAIRFNQTGGGNWSKIKRPMKANPNVVT